MSESIFKYSSRFCHTYGRPGADSEKASANNWLDTQVPQLGVSGRFDLPVRKSLVAKF